MKDAWFVALCAIALFTIIEAKPWTRGSGHGNYADDSDELGGAGYGSRSYSAGAIGGGKGSGGFGRGPRRSGRIRHTSEELDYLSYLKPYCSGPGCSIVSIGNGHHNTNILDLVSK